MTTKWNGKFFENDEAEETADFDPDHVVTVSELTGELPQAEAEKAALATAEADDYRQLLAEIHKPYVPPVEKTLSRGMKILLLVLAIATSVVGGLLAAYGLSFFRGMEFSFPGLLPTAVATSVFLFSSFAFFCTKGKTEKLLMIIFLISGATALCSFFTSF